MKRRALLIGALTLTVAKTRAQQTAPVRRVGLLTIEIENAKDWITGVRQGLREQGFSESNNLRFEYRNGLTRYDQLFDAAQQLVNGKVDVLAPFGDTATRAAIKATSTIPIVMLMSADPVEAGFVASLARPGGNVTGYNLFSRLLLAKRLEILKEILPGLKSVAVLVNPSSAGQVDAFHNMDAAAKSLDLRLSKVEIHSAQEIETAIASAAKGGAGALSAVPSSTLQRHPEAIARATLANRLPSLFPTSAYVDAGGLMSYSAKFSEGYRRQGFNIGRILKGEKAATLPVEQPTDFEFVVNMKTARALGITIPQIVLVRADRVIE